MDSPISGEEPRPPEVPPTPQEEPVIDFTAEPEAAADPEPPSPESSNAEEHDEHDGTLESVDPDPSDDDAVSAARLRALVAAWINQAGSVGGFSNASVGDGTHVFQAAKMYIHGAEFAAVPRRGPVPASLLRPLTSVYAEARCHRKLLAALQHSPIQCLIGTPRTGRNTAAIAVAADYLERRGLKVEGNVHILASDRGLATVDEKAIPEDAALVIDVSELQSAHFGPIEDELRRKRSVLIVVAAAEPAGPAAHSLNRTVAYEPPSTDLVFRKHLGMRLPADRVDAIVALRSVRTNLRPCRSANEAARLAAAVLSEIDNGAKDADLLSEMEPSGQLADAAKELTSGEHWKRHFLIAATVLSDLTASTVVREAYRLAELHEPDLGETPRSRWFEGPIDLWSPSVVLADQDDHGTGRTVRLTHPGLAPHLLRLVWREHLGERDLLLAWLLGLGDHPQRPVRDKAAEAAAQLACYDFEVVTREVIRPWALDGRYRTRQTAALAVETLTVADDGRFASRVQQLVKRWATGGNVRLLAASAVAYGTFLGAQEPQAALSGIRGITGSRVNRSHWRRGSSRPERIERELAGIVRKALVNLFDAGAQENVLLELEQWTVLPHWRWKKAAARSLVDLAGKVGRDGAPLLVELAAGQSEIYDTVLTLWRNAFGHEYRNEASWDALQRWLDFADDRRGTDATEAVAVIDRLAADLRNDADIAESFAFHQQIWDFRKHKRLPRNPDTSLPWRPRHV
ncbi:hypothetical protein GCM10009853_066160 [Glycomyces scopariae]